MEDKACHASKGKTARTEVMFRKGGYVYVYFVYGIYWILNVVAGPEGEPQAARIWIEESGFTSYYNTAARIGVNYAGDPCKNMPWRYILRQHERCIACFLRLQAVSSCRISNVKLQRYPFF